MLFYTTQGSYSKHNIIIINIIIPLNILAIKLKFENSFYKKEKNFNVALTKAKIADSSIRENRGSFAYKSSVRYIC